MATYAQAYQEIGISFRASAKGRRHQLTDDDFRMVEGNFEALVSRIQQKTRRCRDVIEKFFSGMTVRGSSAVASVAKAANEYGHRGGRSRERYDGAEHLGAPPPDGDSRPGFGRRLGCRVDRRSCDPKPCRQFPGSRCRNNSPGHLSSILSLTGIDFSSIHASLIMPSPRLTIEKPMNPIKNSVVATFDSHERAKTPSASCKRAATT